MNVHLGETLEKFVTELIDTGLYQSQSEVIREGLRLLKEREDLRKLTCVVFPAVTTSSCTVLS